jgi:hypothetical protein
MKRKPEWTTEEFETLLQNPSLTDERLHLKLPNRTPAAIQVVRGGIHAFHLGQNTSMLSKLMITRLRSGASRLICPICGFELEES